MLIVALVVTWTNAEADEFADVDPDRLARGVEILAAKWAMPIVVFYGATDEFAETNDEDAVLTKAPKPIIPDTLDYPSRPCAFQDADTGLTGFLRFGADSGCILGALTRRRN